MTVKHRIIKNPSGYHSKGANPKEKAINFGKFVKQYGWSGRWEENQETGDITLVAERETEKIEVFWTMPIAWPEVFYSYAGNKIKCRNISAAAKLAQQEPDPDRMRRAVRKRKALALAHPVEAPSGDGTGLSEDGVPLDLPEALGGLRRGMRPLTDAEIASLAGYLPWDKEPTVDEVKHELAMSTITWVNRLTATAHTAFIKRRHFSVTKNKEGKIIVNFADDNGFHSVYVNSIIGVS